MARKRISQLPAITVPNDADVLPVVQSGVTDKITRSNFLTGVYRSGGTDVPVADGGTGASTASGARTNLGLIIGTDVQQYDATLAAIAAYNANGIITQTGADTFAGRTITGTANKIDVTNGDGVAGNPTITVPSSAQLDVAKLTNLSSNGFVKTGSGDGSLSVDTSTYLSAATGVASIKKTGSAALHGDVTLSAGVNVTLTQSGQDISIAASGGGGGGGSLSDGDYGDITVSGSGTALTVDDGAITEAKQTLADNTTQDVTSTQHGYAPKAPADAATFLNGAATPAFAAVKDSDLATTDVTTNDASTTKHGFAVKATAPSAGIRNVVCIDNGETVYKNAALLDNTNPAALGTAAPGTSLVAARRDHVHATPGVGALTLVEAKTITANATTVTFSGLAGNTDGMYKLVCKIKNNSGAAPFYALRPNGVTTNLVSTLSYDFNGAARASGSTGRFAFAADTGAHWMSVVVDIQAKKDAHSIASPVLWEAISSCYDGSSTFLGTARAAGIWNETATEVTSIDIVSESANGIGDGSQLFLYKYAQS